MNVSTPENMNPCSSGGEPDDARAPAGPGLFRQLGPAGPLAIVAGTLPAIGGFTLLGLLTTISPWLREHQEVALPLYIAAYALGSGLALLPTYAQAVLGGWAFGVLLGLPAAMCGLVGGALIGYFIGQKATGDRLVRIIGKKPRWQAVYAALLGSGFWKTLLIVTLVRLNSPFSLTNFFFAAARVDFVAYIVGTIAGLAPRTAIAVVVASRLQSVEAENPYRAWILVGTIAVTLMVVLLLGQMANRALHRVTTAEGATPPTPAPDTTAP